jgi:hypothetical protein
MIRDVRSLSHFLLVSSILCASCRNNSSEAQQAPAPPPAPSEQPAATASEQAPTTPPAPPKSDPVNAQGLLKAGLATMQPRISSQVVAVGKIEPTPQGRMFMHPGEDKNGVLEFDTKGLTSLEMAPFIQDFNNNPDCMSSPSAGVVQLTWTVDNGKQNHVTVDRNYTGTIPVPLAKSSHLKLEVDKGNGTTLCDWFSVGFLNVK